MALTHDVTGIVSRKYIVTSANDKKEPDPDDTYWVFRVDEDRPHAAIAVIAYIQSVEKVFGMTSLTIALTTLAREYSYKGYRQLKIGKRYNIAKEDGSPIDPKAKYFVVQVNVDPFARYPMYAYANSISTERPRLARDMKELVECSTWKNFGLLI